MGMLFELAKTENYLGIDFEQAYWAIDDVGIGEQSGVFGLGMTLHAYPTREAKKLTEEQAIVGQKPFGASTSYNYNAVLYEFNLFLPINTAFPDGNIPASLDGLKTRAYNIIKAYLNLTSVVDIFEK